MSTVINFPNSMNLSAIKATAEPSMKGEYLTYGSSNQTYGATQTIKIPIPSASNIWLHGQDCFISGRVKIDATSTGGSLSLDGNMFSLFKNARLYNGGNLLTEINDCHRLFHALFDLQVSPSDRLAKEVTHCIEPASLYGLYGQTIVSGKYMYFSLTLPMSIVGSLCDKSFPLTALKTGLLLELDVEQLHKILTTRDEGAQTGSTAVALTKIEIDQIYFHAKVSDVGIYNDILMSALGPSVVIPSVEYKGNNIEIPANTTSMTSNFSFPLKSAKNIIFWFTNSATANGTVTNGTLGTTAGKLNSALTQRTFGGNMKNYQLNIDGKTFCQPIDVSAGSNLALNVRGSSVNGSIPMQHLFRAFNLNSSVSAGGILCENLYSNASSTWLGDYDTKRTILAYDLDRGSNDGDKFFQGINLLNSTVSMRAEWNSPLAESQTLYAYCLHDIGFVIENGECKASV